MAAQTLSTHKVTQETSQANSPTKPETPAQKINKPGAAETHKTGQTAASEEKATKPGVPENTIEYFNKLESQVKLQAFWAGLAQTAHSGSKPGVREYKVPEAGLEKVVAPDGRVIPLPRDLVCPGATVKVRVSEVSKHKVNYEVTIVGGSMLTHDTKSLLMSIGVGVSSKGVVSILRTQNLGALARGAIGFLAGRVGLMAIGAFAPMSVGAPQHRRVTLGTQFGRAGGTVTYWSVGKLR